MNRRIVKLRDKITGDCLIILTDTPREILEKWIVAHNGAESIGKKTSIYNLGEEYYVKVLHDSETDPPEDIDLYHEEATYELHYTRRWEMRRTDILEAIRKTFTEKGVMILGQTSDTIIVHNDSEGPNFCIKVTKDQ